MPAPFLIQAAGESVCAELFDTNCARAIAAALPISARANTWGREIYFKVGVNERLDETAREAVNLGDIGYWPTGDAICFFFGPTPASAPGEIRPASAVNIVGRIRGDLEALKRVRDGQMVTLRLADGD